MHRNLFCWLLPLLLISCVSHSGLEPAPFHLASVSPRHRAAFVGLLEALEGQENKRAGEILDRLIPRLKAEMELEDGVLKAEVDWQWVAAKRFRRILMGRERLASLDFTLQVTGEKGRRSMSLTIKSHWPGVLVLQPGPAILEQHAWLIGRGGESSEHGRSRVVSIDEPMEIGPLATLELDLGVYRSMSLGGALGMRETFLLRMGAGGVHEDGEIYPAQHWPDASGMRVSLPAFLPNGVLAPSELLGRVEDAGLGMPGLVERVVRISPERYGETLRGFVGPVNRATPEMFARMEPLLRWLCAHDPQPSGLEAWRAHLARLSQG